MSCRIGCPASLGARAQSTLIGVSTQSRQWPFTSATGENAEFAGNIPYLTSPHLGTPLAEGAAMPSIRFIFCLAGALSIAGCGSAGAFFTDGTVGTGGQGMGAVGGSGG